MPPTLFNISDTGVVKIKPLANVAKIYAISPANGQRQAAYVPVEVNRLVSRPVDSAGDKGQSRGDVVIREDAEASVGSNSAVQLGDVDMGGDRSSFDMFVWQIRH